MNYKETEAHFLKHGWFVFDLLETKALKEAKEALEKKLEARLGKKVALAEYHREAEDDGIHHVIQKEMTEFFRANLWGPKIIAAQRPFFEYLLGRDLLVQANPYLRMTRPGKPQDNIGYHRDTFYGGSPYELSVLIPFLDVPAESSLQVLSGSHILPEDHYPTTQIPNPDREVTKGSSKHQLGFLYAPKVMDPSIEKEMRGIPLKLGQALVFTLSTVHGSVVNQGQVTRWSTDIRVMHAFAPVDLSARPDYYRPFSSSPVTQVAKTYYNGISDENRNPIELELCH